MVAFSKGWSTTGGGQKVDFYKGIIIIIIIPYFNTSSCKDP
jgi:hypothetical protein